MTRRASVFATRAARSTGLLCVGTWLIAGCTTLSPLPPVTGETLSGRLVVKVDGSDGVAPRSTTAAFELQGDRQAGRLNLSTPLGSVMAQARWNGRDVVLATPKGETEFADLDALTEEALGESLPVAALFDWLRGRPWPGAPSTAVAPPDSAGFEQLGWSVGLAQYDQGVVTARRARPPVVTVRAKLDRP